MNCKHALYRELKINETYNREEFVDKIAEELKPYELDKQGVLTALLQQFEAEEEYNPYTAKVLLKHCTPPVELAYHLLNKNVVSDKPLEAATKKQIEERVYGLLNGFKHSKKMTFHADYLQFLTKTNATQEQIRSIHQNCVQEFLTKHAKTSLPWYKRLLGYSSQLHRVTSTAGYLILFRSLMSVPGGADKTTELALIKDTSIALLKAYRYQSVWSITNERKALVEKLIDDLTAANKVATIVNALNTCQLNVINDDIEGNKKRWIPLHLSGASRLQNALSNALNVISTVSQDKVNSPKEILKAYDTADRLNKKVIAQQLYSFFNRGSSAVTKNPVGKHKNKQNKEEASDSHTDLDEVLKKIKS